MSHRQKNKHKSRHRIHPNNGPRIPQIGRAASGPANTVATPPVATPPVAEVVAPVVVDTAAPTAVA